MTPTLDDIRQDSLAFSVAEAVVLADQTAIAHGKDLDQCRITIMEESPPPARYWRIHYGRRDARNHRGGDLIVIVNATLRTVDRVIRGQ